MRSSIVVGKGLVIREKSELSMKGMMSHPWMLVLSWEEKGTVGFLVPCRMAPWSWRFEGGSIKVRLMQGEGWTVKDFTYRCP